MTRILTIGEAMVELAPLPDPATFRMGYAGDTMNTAWYLQTLLPDAQIDFCTAVGTDEVSDHMVSFLSEAGIGTEFIFRRDDKTCGLYMIQLADGERSFNYWRSDSAARSLAREKNALRAAMAGADMVYFSGITIAILPDDDREQLLTALRDYRATGGTVVFDPNLRPRLWPDTQLMMPAIMDAAAVSDIALPSFEDEADWFGDASPNDTAHRYAAAGAHTVIVKNGASAISALQNSEISTHSPLSVAEIVDTTAAGDSFNAGFIASTLTGQPISVAIQAGATVSAQVIQSRGALVPGIPLG